MSRVIKFRGRLSHSKEWVEGNLIIARDGRPYIIPFDVFEPDGHHLIIDSDSPFWVDPETVGQFTGLTDQNGVEIYEGDIIRRSLSGATPTTTDKVYFHKGQFVIGTGDYIKPLSSYYSVEVIGNIYQTNTEEK